MTLNCYKFNFSWNFALSFAFLDEQMFVVDGVTMKNATEGCLVSYVLNTKAVARLPLR